MAAPRVWVALGLVLRAHPRVGRGLDLTALEAGGALEASPEDLLNVLPLRPKDVTVIFSGAFPAQADREIEAARRAGVGLLTFGDAGYPARLRRLPDPPPFICVKGGLDRLGPASAAVVGSRRATPYGLQVARRLGRDLAAAGVTVVSGLARGIDTAAHRGALDAAGATVGVLGSGIDVIYPSENAGLFGQVAEVGALVTEYPFGAPPLARNFPVRNRIIAALSDVVLVVEAARDSGSLITAGLAADALGLPVCAVPGPTTSRTSEGCNDLIYDGATPVRDVRDVLYLLEPEALRAAAARRAAPLGGAGGSAGSAAAHGLSREARALLDALSPHAPRSADELAGDAGLAPAALLGHLLDLEMRGLAVQLPGGLYVRKI